MCLVSSYIANPSLQPTCRAPHPQQPRRGYVPAATAVPPIGEQSTVTNAAPLHSSQVSEPLTASSIRAAPTKAYRRVGSSLSAAAAPSAASQQSGGELTLLSRAAYQGVPGAFSEMAALQACPGYELLPCEQFEVAFQALSQWMAERAVLPIENSLGGSIHTVYDLLLRYNLHIVGETSIAVKHCLMALPGTAKGDLKRVMSHPQALAQTDGYLRKMGVVREAVDDTAGAAKMIKENGWRDAGAVASARAAELYGMEVLDTDIQDMEANVTRFLVLSRDPFVITDTSKAYKTSIVFSLQEGPGTLFKALSVFALRDIDLTKIESRPMRSNPIVTAARGDEQSQGTRRFNFLFYIDFVGSLANPACQNALRHLQEIAPFVRVLGSYPMDMDLGGLDAAQKDSNGAAA